jgi:transcriptional regulator with XRE-family HTH domain
MSAIGDAIRDARIQRHVTQRGLADLSGVSRSMIQAIERGTKIPELKTLEKLAPVLGFQLYTLVDLAKRSRLLPPPASRCLGTSSDAKAASSGTTPGVTTRPSPLRLRLDGDRAALHQLSWPMRDLRRIDIELIHATAFPALDEYSKRSWRASEEAQRLRIGFHLTLAASVQERNAVPALEEGLWHAGQAKTIAMVIGDTFGADFATWYQAVLRRKRAIVRGKRWADADLEDDYRTAQQLGEELLHSSDWPEILMAVSAEQMKLAIEANDASRFDTWLAIGERQTHPAIVVRRRWHAIEAWPAFFSEHMHTVLYDAKVRGYERFGLETRARLDHAVAQTTRFPQGLSTNIGFVTLELGKAAALLRLSDADMRVEGLLTVGRAKRTAVAWDQQQQVRRAERILRERERHLPLTLRLWCDQCEKETWSERRPGGYRCTVCKQPTL